jgi:AraC-like DNA-binding protein
VLEYREFRPPTALRELLECGWRARLEPGAPPHPQRVLPDGCMDLIVIDTQPWVAGPDRTAFVAAQEPGTVLTGLRFRPGAAPRLLGVPACELAGRRVLLSAVRPSLAHRITALLEQGRRPGQALLGSVRDELPTAAPADPALPGAARLLGAGASVATTADVLGWTTRTLHRRAHQGFGYGPATVRRVLRFRAAVALAWLGTPAAQIAASTGYADQAHLAREVRALAGVPLTQLRPAPHPKGLESGFPDLERPYLHTHGPRGAADSEPPGPIR